MPDEITFRSDFTVDLIDRMGDDLSVIRAARVSTGKDHVSGSTEADSGLINFLMKNRHGTPFEHGSMTFRIEAPIVVWREFMRHRIGFSYNEQSGRYMEMLPVFYVPPPERPMIQVGKPGAYSFEHDFLLSTKASAVLKAAYQGAWDSYQKMLDYGIAKEAARLCMPVGAYSAAYVTCNPRSLMSFLSLRTKVESSTFPSFPQWEIEQVANAMEADFSVLYGTTWAAFCRNGRVSP